MCQYFPDVVVHMRRGVSGGGQDEEEGAEVMAGLNVASFALNSASPLHHQPAINAASIMPTQSTMAITADVGR